MKIDEILKQKRTLSFEVFPPKKNNADKDKLLKTIHEIAALNPDFISVTYGAGGNNARDAIEIASYIQQQGIEALAHLTGGPSTPAQIDEVSARLKESGIENIMALRGDRPLDFKQDYCKHFKHASDLMEYLDDDFCLGGACYPEGHSECATLREDLENLKKKQEAGAKFFITQIFYDNSYYYRLVHEARKAGITIPIIPGIMPLTHPGNIPRIQTMCGSTIPLDFRNMIETYAGQPEVMKEIGVNYTVYQIIDLIAKGAPGIHLYIMNHADVAKAVHSRLETVFHELFA